MWLFPMTFTGGVLAAIVILSLTTIASVAVAAVVYVKMKRKGTLIAYKCKTQAFILCQPTIRILVILTKKSCLAMSVLLTNRNDTHR